MCYIQKRCTYFMKLSQIKVVITYFCFAVLLITSYAQNPKSNMAQGCTIQAILIAISGSDLKLILSGEENRTRVISKCWYKFCKYGAILKFLKLILSGEEDRTRVISKYWYNSCKQGTIMKFLKLILSGEENRTRVISGIEIEITLVLFCSPDKINFKMAPYLQKLYQHFEITIVLHSSPDKINFKSLPEMVFKIA